jgi:transposase
LVFITFFIKNNDRLDADKICDLLRCELLPQCYLAPPELRELRRVLRYRNLLVSEAVRMKNKISGLLMEMGEPYDARRLHGKKYFSQYIDSLENTPESVVDLLRISRSSLELFERLQRRLLAGLQRQPMLKQRLERLQSIRGVGEVLALSWALEIAEVKRFSSLGQAVSSCGLCAAQRESAGKSYRGPLSKQRNKHLQRVLIEAAKLAPRWNPRLRQVRDRELERGHRNRATLAVARKLVAYLLAVDRSGQAFVEESRAAGRGTPPKLNEKRKTKISLWSRAACRSSPVGDCAGKLRFPMRPKCLFRGRQAKPKLNLPRRRRRPMRQMDVWSL